MLQDLNTNFFYLSHITESSMGGEVILDLLSTMSCSELWAF